MDTTIDTLAIEIESESGNSTQNMEALISVLERLNASINSSLSNLDKFKKSLTNINNVKIKDIKAPKVTTGVGSKPKAKSTGSNTSISPKSGKTASTDVPNAKSVQEAGKEADVAKTKFQKLLEVLQRVGNTLKNIKPTGVEKSQKSMTQLRNTLKKILPDSQKLGTSLKKAFSSSITGSAKKFTLAMLGVRSLYTTLRSAVQEYMNYDVKLNDELRNNWAVLGSLLAPILEKIIYLFGIAIGYVRAFIKALTGIDLVARANSKSIKSIGDSAKKTLGNLAKFDDLNVVEFPDSSGSGDELPALTTPDVDTSKLEWFVDFIKRGDWYGLGMEIGRMFNEGLRTIDFDWLIEKATQWGKNMGDLFNGLTDGTDWTLLGEKLAGGLNTALAFVNTFFDTYNFDNLGSSLAEGLNSAILNVNWEGLGQYFTNGLASAIDTGYTFVNDFNFDGFGTRIGDAINGALYNIDFTGAGMTIAKALTGALDTLGSAIKRVDWAYIAQSISDFVYNIFDELRIWIQDTDWGQVGQDLYDNIVLFLSEVDWEGIVSSLFELLGSALGAVGTLLATFVKNIVSDIADYFAQYIEEGDDWQESGKNIILGVLEGIKDAVVNIGTWIWDNIFVPFIDGFKEAFDINSPSKVMEEQGGFILEGLLNGLKGIGDAVGRLFQEAKEAIKRKCDEIFTDIKNTFSVDNIKKTFENVKTAITNKFTEIKNNIKTKMSEAWTGMTSVFSIKKMGDHFQKIFDKIKDIFKTIGTTVGNVIGESFANVVNAIIGFAEDTINKFIKAINKAIKVINKIPGVNITKLDTIEIPKLATGTNRIESEGLYHLHKNEAVVPAKYNPAVNDDLYNNSNDEVVAELQSLREAVNNMSTTNIINLGNKTLYKETISYARSQNEKYGENVMSF